MTLQKVHYRAQNILSYTPVLVRLVQIMAIHERHVLILSSHLSQGLASGFFSFGVSQPKPVTGLYSPHECHMLNPSHLPWFYRSSSIRRGAEFMKLHITQFSPISCYLRSAHPFYAAWNTKRMKISFTPRWKLGIVSSYVLPLTPKCLPQHPILEYPQARFFPQCRRLGFLLTQNSGQNYTSVYFNFIFFVLY